MRIPKPVRQFILQSAIWTSLCLLVEAICRFVLHLGYPYNYPGIQPVNFFADFRFLRLRFLHFHSREFFNVADPMNYPPPLLVVYKFFMLKPLLSHPAFATLRFASFLLLTSWVVLWLFGKALVERGLSRRQASLFLLATYVFSFAYWFEFQQSNMEIIVWIMVCLGVWAYWSNRLWAACVFFGLAAAMKIFPLVFLGLFVAKRQYKQVIGAVVVIAVATVTTLWIVCPDLPYASQKILAGLSSFGRSQSMQMLQVALGFDHSLFALVKRVIAVTSPNFPLDHALKYYMPLVAIGGILLFFLRIRKLPLVNQVICLCVAAILLPPTSYDYTLLHLYPAFALLVFCAMEYEVDGKSGRGLLVAFALLAFLLSPQSEFILHGARFSAQLKAVALALLGIVALAVPFPTRRDASSLVETTVP